LPEARFVKHLRATPKVKIPYLIGAISECDQCRYDCSCTRAGDIIEIIRENELCIPATPAQLRFYARQDFNADHSANPSAVACEQSPRTGLGQFIAVTHVIDIWGFSYG